LQEERYILEDLHNPDDFANRKKSLIYVKTHNDNDISPTETKKS
jgi:hypothetical protein